MEPRPYRDKRDFEKMLTLLVEGRRANSGTYYVHVGDVQWWLFYPNQEAGFSERIFLWEEGEALLGWCLLTPRQRVYDLFVHPSLLGSAETEALECWAEARLTDMVKADGGTGIETDWIAESDSARIESLTRRGYQAGGYSLNYFTRSLADSIPAPPLPDGYTIRPSAGEGEAAERARASHSAFRSKWEWDKYMERRLSFMRSPVYENDRDMVVAAPGERIASFCIYWLDEVNRIGLFEPVGTHPEFQGRGLGKALMSETLRRMKARGMESAMVCAETANPAANRLYESAGFKKQHRLLLFQKSLT